MVAFDLPRRAAAEALGTLLLVAAVVGSGIMAAKLAQENIALALLANAIATGCALVVLITIFGPVSGAHFNPAVSLVMWLRGTLTRFDFGIYVATQIAGGIAGTTLAHAMFELPLLQYSTTVRTGSGQWIAEAIATFGLIGTILGCIRFVPTATPAAVGLYITSAYWFTASTSFANPAVTIARAFTDTFAGIAPAGVPAFIAAQFAGAVLGLVIFRWLFQDE